MPRARAAQESALAAALGDAPRQIGVFEERICARPERIRLDAALDAAVVALTQAGGRRTLGLSERAPEATGEATIAARMAVDAAGPLVLRETSCAAAAQAPWTVRRIRRPARIPEAERAAVDAEIERQAASAPDLAERRRPLRAAPGVGPVVDPVVGPRRGTPAWAPRVAATPIAMPPEPGPLDRRRIAGLAGGLRPMPAPPVPVGAADSA